ncbi:MAG: ABC transporter ATP-binding protein [Thermoanaerobaculia bacterium]
MGPVLELDAVRKSYGEFTAVDGVSFAVEPGSICGLLGPNGAGKTTSIRMIMDIIAPDSGEVRFFGRPRQRDDLLRVGYLPEERGLYRKMTVTDHLVFLARLHGAGKRETMPAIGEWLERVGLSEWAGKKVEELSKGMQQKIQLVGTVLHQPDLLVLDEPFSGLDPINQGLFKELLADYRRDGKAVLFSTHIMEQADKLCDRICLISHGRAVLAGELKEIKRRFGGNSYRLVADGDLSRLAELPGVAQAIARDDGAKLLLEDDAAGAEVLPRLLEAVTVHEFRSEEPELEEIFIQVVGHAEGAADQEGTENRAV